MKELLDEVRKNPEFQAVLENSLKQRPVIPAFFIAKTKDEQEQVVEQIKFHTAMRQGFDLLYQYLSGRKPKGETNE